MALAKEWPTSTIYGKPWAELTKVQQVSISRLIADYQTLHSQSQDFGVGGQSDCHHGECDRCLNEGYVMLDETTIGAGDFEYCERCWEQVGNQAAGHLNEIFGK